VRRADRHRRGHRDDDRKVRHLSGRAYYNELDPFAAGWLRELIAEGLIADGDVDERSIVGVQPADLAGYDQCHFFAGIGGWSYALRLAGWPDDRPVWTGSCPCQPLSGAGQRKGHADERHLWPAFYRLIAERRPATLFGEQVASKDGREWLAGVRADLEALGYAVGAADLCAAGVGAPHIRQRLFWVADAGEGQRGRLTDREGRECCGPAPGWFKGDGELESRCDDGGLAYSDGRFSGHGGLQPGGKHGQQPQDRLAGERMADSNSARLEERSAQPSPPERATVERSGDAERVADTGQAERRRWSAEGVRPAGVQHTSERCARSGLADADSGGIWQQPIAELWRGPSPWASAAYIDCADGKARRVEPGIFPLAHGLSNRMGLLRGAGNAIVPQAAAEFIAAYLEIPGVAA
jgi:DNA (cytosine-5)-methyltransferase 1